MTKLAGLYPPIATPYDDQERLALDRLEHNVQLYAALPLDGVVMPGSNSEAAFFSAEERLSAWRVCAAVMRAHNKQLIAGSGVETTAETIQLTLRAAELGAVAALVLPPYFFKSELTHDTLLAHYVAVADASPIPLLVYNMPLFTGIDFTLQTLLALAEHPNIIGMKDSSSNVVKIGMLLAAQPQFQVFAGSGGALLPFLSIGAVGGINALANVAARPLRRLYTAFEQGDLKQARQLQLALAELNNALSSFGVPGLKYAMDQLGFYGGPPRRPLQPLRAEGRTRIDAVLARLAAQDLELGA